MLSPSFGTFRRLLHPQPFSRFCSDLELPPGRCSVLAQKCLPRSRFSSLTCAANTTKIAPVSAPETVRRIKTSSAATGCVYQYQFHEVHPARRGFSSGAEYVYLVWATRQTGFPLKIFV